MSRMTEPITTSAARLATIINSKAPQYTKLEDQIPTMICNVNSTATLTAVENSRQGYLDSDNKLSSAGAAASLKYANPEELPSFPSRGLSSNETAAGAAASLGWATQKSFEYWKPDSSAHASTAAIIAKDYKLAPTWQPGKSVNSTKAAVLAHKNDGKVQISKPTASTWVNSAANSAFQKRKTAILSPRSDDGHTAIQRSGSLIAAKGAMSTRRKRSESSPSTLPYNLSDECKAFSSALSAATLASNASQRNNHYSENGSSTYTSISKDMFTPNPPLTPKIEERNRRDTLHASAVATARQMYAIQQNTHNDSTSSQVAAAAYDRLASVPSEVQPMRLKTLQEEAKKHAQQRLSRIYGEHHKNQEYCDHYDGSTISTAPNDQPSQSYLPIRGRTLNRSGGIHIPDKGQEHGNNIRAQTSLFSSDFSEVDVKKRDQDCEALVAVAQRNVRASLHGMDERFFEDTGKKRNSWLSEWELKAHAAAQTQIDDRIENYGKINIGGGKFIDQTKVDEVAKRNIQPILDDIQDKAERERERVTTEKMEKEKEVRATAQNKKRAKEEKAINRIIQRHNKDDLKARENEEKRLNKERHQLLKTSNTKATTAKPTTPGQVSEPRAEEFSTNLEFVPISPRAASLVRNEVRTLAEDEASLCMCEISDKANCSSATTNNGDGRVKTWLKTKVLRRMSIGKGLSEDPNEEKGFIGGVALTANKDDRAAASGSAISLSASSKAEGQDKEREAYNKRDIPDKAELCGRKSTARSESDDSAVSDEYVEARENFEVQAELALPPALRVDNSMKSRSPIRETRFVEDI